MTYRERRLARAERLRDWSSSRRTKSAAAFDSARRIADAIPFGQPILVGHHSERHARADQARIWNGMSKGVEHQQKAANMASRAANIEDAVERAIYDDDPDAIERLAEKILLLEDRRETIKTRNADYRNKHRAELKAMTSAYDRDCAMPHQRYELQNLGGNITRCRQRLGALQAAKTSTGNAFPIAEGDLLARSALTITATLTTPAKAWKKPREVWNVGGNLAYWRPMLESIGGSLYRGVMSFWEDPTDDIVRELAKEEV